MQCNSIAGLHLYNCIIPISTLSHATAAVSVQGMPTMLASSRNWRVLGDDVPLASCQANLMLVTCTTIS